MAADDKIDFLQKQICRALQRLYGNRLPTSVRAYNILAGSVDLSYLDRYNLPEEHPSTYPSLYLKR